MSGLISGAAGETPAAAALTVFSQSAVKFSHTSPRDSTPPDRAQPALPRNDKHSEFHSGCKLGGSEAGGGAARGNGRKKTNNKTPALST